MLDVNYGPARNGHKITVVLAETGTGYKLNPVHIDRGEPFNPGIDQHAKRFLPGQTADMVGAGVP